MLPTPLYPSLSGFFLTSHHKTARTKQRQQEKTKNRKVNVTNNICVAKPSEYLSDLIVTNTL